MFDHLQVRDRSRPVPDLQQLRERVRHLEQTTTRVELAAHPSVRGVVALHGGGSYEVSDLGLAMALLAGPSAAGDWCAVVGVPDFGVEAAAGCGVDLARTVLVPTPGEQWLEVTAALTDTVPVVLLRPGARVAQVDAARLAARLRKRGAVLLVHAAPGSWPRCEARLSTTASTWTGLGSGHGRLRSRQVRVEVRRGAAPPRTVDLLLSGGRDDQVGPVPVPAPGRPTTARPFSEAV